MKCVKCQAEIDDDSIFCSECGAKQTTVTADTAVNVAPSTSNNESSTASQPMPQIQVNVQQPQMVPQLIMMQNKKSMGIALLLSLLFGPLGLLYSSIMGGVVMLVLSLIIVPLTLGIGALITWPICVIWSIIAVRKHNAEIDRAIMVQNQQMQQ